MYILTWAFFKCILCNSAYFVDLDVQCQSSGGGGENMAVLVILLDTDYDPEIYSSTMCWQFGHVGQHGTVWHHEQRKPH